jgi:hypothetical protein
MREFPITVLVKYRDNTSATVIEIITMDKALKMAIIALPRSNSKTKLSIILKVYLLLQGLCRNASYAKPGMAKISMQLYEADNEQDNFPCSASPQGITSKVQHSSYCGAAKESDPGVCNSK